MRFSSAFFAFVLALLSGGCHNDRPSDAALRARLTGTWNVRVVGPDGSSDTHGTFTVAPDDSYRSELVTTVSNETRRVTLQGFISIREGFLIVTTTNAVPHWLPEARRGTLPLGGAISRSRIVRLDERELMIETNQFGSVLYTKVTQ